MPAMRSWTPILSKPDFKINVRPLKPTIRGTLSRAQIERVIRANIDKLQKLYEQALRKDARLSGDLTLSLLIDSQGRVQRVRIASSTMGN